MIEKKISRRGFIKVLATCSVAIPFLPDIIAASPPPMIVVDKALEVGSGNLMNPEEFNGLAIIPGKPFTRTGMPDVKWRKLTGKGTEEIKEMLAAPNEILSDLNWRPV